MGVPVKLSDDLVNEAREEAKAADRSITSQIEHWARLGRTVEGVVRHRAGDPSVAPRTRRAMLSAIARVASADARPDLASSLMQGRAVYQDAGDGLIERIEVDGTRTIGRFVNRRFTPDQAERPTRRK
jgi:hypothetical protein